MSTRPYCSRIRCPKRSVVGVAGFGRDFGVLFRAGETHCRNGELKGMGSSTYNRKIFGLEIALFEGRQAVIWCQGQSLQSDVRLLLHYHPAPLCMDPIQCSAPVIGNSSRAHGNHNPITPMYPKTLINSLPFDISLGIIPFTPSAHHIL